MGCEVCVEAAVACVHDAWVCTWLCMHVQHVYVGGIFMVGEWVVVVVSTAAGRAYHVHRQCQGERAR